MEAEDLIWSFTCCSFSFKKWVQPFFFFSCNHAEHYQVYKTCLWKGDSIIIIFFHIKLSQIVRYQGNKLFHPLQERYTLALVCSSVTMFLFFFILPNVGECPRVCFSLISVVLVVYQPGKWLWWCQLTPHCHSRFVSQPHRLSHPPSHPSLYLTSHHHHPFLTSPSLTPPPFFFSLCDVFSSVCYFCVFFFFSLLILHQWWWQMVFSSINTQLGFSLCAQTIIVQKGVTPFCKGCKTQCLFLAV